MQDKGRRSDQTVAAFFLDTRQTAEKFIGYILAQPGLAQGSARQFQNLGVAFRGLAVSQIALQPELYLFLFVDLAEVVIEPLHFQPVTVRRHHLPGLQVIQRRAPENSFLAPGVHRHIAADGRGVL